MGSIVPATINRRVNDQRQIIYKMGLGVLNDSKMEHVPGMWHSCLILNLITETQRSIAGTSLVYDDASRPAEPSVMDTRLKYDTTRPIPIILVPQPSDDPNDPLVGSGSGPKSAARRMLTVSRIELASMEARCHPTSPFPTIGHGLDAQPTARCEHLDAVALVWQHIYTDSASYRIPSMRRGSGRLPLRGIRKSLGETPPVPPR